MGDKEVMTDEFDCAESSKYSQERKAITPRRMSAVVRLFEERI